MFLDLFRSYISLAYIILKTVKMTQISEPTTIYEHNNTSMKLLSKN